MFHLENGEVTRKELDGMVLAKGDESFNQCVPILIFLEAVNIFETQPITHEFARYYFNKNEMIDLDVKVYYSNSRNVWLLKGSGKCLCQA